MSRAFGASLLMVGLLAAAAQANDPTDLSGGALLFHHPLEPVGDDVCDVTLNGVGEQNPTVWGAVGDPVDFYVLAAFDTGKTLYGVEFGFGDFDPRIFCFTSWGACRGVEFVDYLELSTAGWPGPNAGTTCVTTGEPWDERIIPIYHFRGIAYGEGVIPLGVDPAHDVAAFTNGKGGRETPEMFPIDEERLGTLGIFTTGQAVAPVAVVRWACCVGDQCLLLHEPECEALNGTWEVGVLSCFPEPCQIGACCFEDAVEGCRLMNELECQQASGIFIPGQDSCDPDPCPRPGACCLAAGRCIVVTEIACWQEGGVFVHGLDDCDPNPCPGVGCETLGGGMAEPSITVVPTNWGTIKSLYR